MKRNLLAQPSSNSRRHEHSQGHSGITQKRRCRSLFISDVHLGSRDSKADYLNTFLKQHSFDTLYLVGDIFDGWKMRKQVYWHKDFNRVIRRILKLAKNGVEIVYVTGNHDEFLRKYANHKFDNIRLCNRTVHTTAKGKQFLVIHGDQFEGVARCGKVLKLIGDVGYRFLMGLNRQFNALRARFGYGYWSFAAFLKQRIQRAQDYIIDYEQAVAYGVRKQGFDGVICGHIHHAAHKMVQDTEYCNTGDWVESCTAFIETDNGDLELIHWLDEQQTEKTLMATDQQNEATTVLRN